MVTIGVDNNIYLLCTFCARHWSITDYPHRLLTGSLCGGFCYTLHFKTQKRRHSDSFSSLVLLPSVSEPTAPGLGASSARLCYTVWPEGVALVPFCSFLQNPVDPVVVNVLGKKVALSCPCPSLKMTEAFGSHTCAWYQRKCRVLSRRKHWLAMPC